MRFLSLLLTQTPEPDAGGLIATIVDAVSTKRYGALVGALLALAIFVGDRLNVLQWCPPQSKKWVAVGLAVLMSVSGGLVAGLPWTAIVGGAVTMATGAIGSYELVLAPIMRRFDKDQA
jgi:hypothetical protein